MVISTASSHYLSLPTLFSLRVTFSPPSQCLIGIILMQAGQAYAQTTEEAEQRKVDARTVRAGATAESVNRSPNEELKKDL